MGAGNLRRQARRALARTLVVPPVYHLASRVPRTAPLAARAAFRTGRDGLLAGSLERLAARHRAAAVLRADLLTFQGRYAEALAAAEQALQGGRSPALLARVVKLGYRVQPKVEADRVAVAAVREFPLQPEVLWQVALACQDSEHYRQLAAAWREAVPGAGGPGQPATVPAAGLPVVRQLAVAASRAGCVADAAGWYAGAIRLVLAVGAPGARTVTTRLAGLSAQTAIRDLCQALDDAGVRFFFAAGTALGLVRAGRPLGADGDIDAGVFAADWDRAALIARFEDDPRFDVDLHPQTEKVGLRHRGGAPIDIFRFYEEDGRLWHDGVFVRWHNSPFEVSRRAIGGLRVPLPEDADRYLTENYGDWRTPRPGFDAFTADAPNVEVTWPEYQRVHLLRRAYDRLAAGDRPAAAREVELAGDKELADQLAVATYPRPTGSPRDHSKQDPGEQ